MNFLKKKKNNDWIAATLRENGQTQAGETPARPVAAAQILPSEKRTGFFKSIFRREETFGESIPGDEWWEKQPPAHRLLRGLFGMVVVFALTVVGLLIFLPINDTVRASAGEILTQNAPTELLAPFEGRLVGQSIREGQRVRRGDTLLVLENEAVQIAFRKSAAEIAIARQGIAALEQLTANLGAQIGEQQQGKNIGIASGRSERAAADSDLRGLREQIASEEGKLNIARSRHEKDQKLYGEGVISAVELQTKYAVVLDVEKSLAALRQTLRQREIAQKNLSNVLADRGNQQDLAVLGRENELLNTQKLLAAEHLRLETLREQYRKDSLEASKQYVAAPADGFVGKLFNARQQVSQISKGQSLLVLSPEGEQQFSARLAVSQHQIRDVQPGSAVRLKVDAFHYLQFGVVPGEVTFVGQDTSAYFYVLAKLRPEENPRIVLKNGYRVQGEIVLARVRLWRFLWNKLFRKEG